MGHSSYQSRDQASVNGVGVEPSRYPSLMAIMDAATWQTEAERQSGDGPPHWRKPLGIAAAALVVLAIIAGGVAWWLNGQQYASTDDAFVDGYVTQVAPQVAGRVTA